jgi:hypothetical protein
MEQERQARRGLGNDRKGLALSARDERLDLSEEKMTAKISNKTSCTTGTKYYLYKYWLGSCTTSRVATYRTLVSKNCTPYCITVLEYWTCTYKYCSNRSLYSSTQ